MVAVSSSNIAAIDYAAGTHQLTVTFTSGARYVYDGVPAEVHEDFLEAGSKGEFFAENIKGIFPYRRG